MTTDFTLADLTAQGVLALSDGYRTRSDQLGSAGLPILRVADVLQGSLAPSYKDFVREEYRPKMGLKVSRAHDVLITTKGTVGRVARVPTGFPEHVYSPQVCFLRSLRPDLLDPGWLFQWARSPELLRQLGIFKDQTDMAPYVSLTDMRRVQISLPSVEEQCRIAAVLGAFDELIETNLKLRDNLVLLAQAALQSNEWPSERVGDVAVLSRGLSYKGSGLRKVATADSTPMVNLANFDDSGWIKSEGIKFYGESFKPSHVLAAGDLLVANTDLTQARKILGRGVLVPPALEGAIHSHHTTSVRFPKNPAYALFLWAQMQGMSFRERAMGYATGTTVTALPREALLDYEFRVPKDWAAVADAGRAILAEAWECENEIVDLTRTRDELLPLLMSGSLRVEDVKAMA